MLSVKRPTSPPITDPTGFLFDMTLCAGEAPEENEVGIKTNIWTYQKSLLISRYLHYFLAVTKNGVYIDAFAGPQEMGNDGQSWSALKVLESRSKFLNQAWLCELDEKKHPELDRLKAEFCQGDRNLSRNLSVKLFKGDCNKLIPEALRRYPFHRKKACFAVLDQRTHECSWKLVRTLAADKSKPKVEILYFLAQGWMNRSFLSAKRDKKIAEIDAWWGGDGWRDFIQLTSYERAYFLRDRFKNELGYRYAKAFPMMSKGSEGSILFWLIHASDHPRAIPLMAAAYRSIGLKISDEEWGQMRLDELLAELPKAPD